MFRPLCIIYISFKTTFRRQRVSEMLKDNRHGQNISKKLENFKYQHKLQNLFPLINIIKVLILWSSGL